MLLFIRDGYTGVPGERQISIHLMLLFIGDPAVERIQEALFQYILCYCLSDGARGVKLFIQISIHLMLLFILSGSRFRPTHV